MLCVSSHTACRFAEKALFFRSLRTERRCAAASRFAFFKGKALYAPVRGASGPVVTTGVPACPLSRASIICFSAALSRTA